jgi:hypothetical protein
MIIIRDGAYLYFIDKKLIMLKGRTKMGKVGIFADEENGLCPHEEVKVYCSFCRESESE